jgi:hypothetical protein
MSLSGLRAKDVEILRSTFRHFSFVREVRVFGSRANGVARRCIATAGKAAIGG